MLARQLGEPLADELDSPMGIELGDLTNLETAVLSSRVGDVGADKFLGDANGEFLVHDVCTLHVSGGVGGTQPHPPRATTKGQRSA